MKSLTWFQIVAYSVASFLALMAAALAFANTGPGQNLVAAAVENTLSSDDLKVKIEGLDGMLPNWPQVSRVTISDPMGEWLILHNVSMNWNPFLLIRGQLVADKISIERIEWLRQPSSKLPHGIKSKMIPAVSFNRLIADDVSISQEVAGIAARLSMQSHVDLRSPAQSATFVLRAVEVAPGTARLAAEFRFDRARSILNANVDLQDRAGGPLAALVGLPSDAPIAITLSTVGNLDNWRGTFLARGGDELEARGTATIRRGGTWRHLALRINAQLGSVGPQSWHSFTSGKTQLIFDAAEDDLGAVRIENLQLASPAVKIRGQGLFNPSGKHTEGTVALDVPDGMRLSGLIGTAWAWRNLSAKARIEGGWPAPAMRITAQLDDLNVEFAKASRVRMSARAVPDRRWDAPGLNIALTTVTRADKVTYESAIAQDLVGSNLDFKLQAVIQDFERLSNVTIDTQQKGLKAYFLGNVDSRSATGELTINGDGLSVPQFGADQFSLRAHVAADRGTSAWAVRGAGHTENVKTNNTAVNKLLTGHNTFEFSLYADAPGFVRISKAALITPHLEARAQGKIDSNKIHIESRLLVPNLSAIGPEFGGRIDAQIRLTGSLITPLISGAGSLTQGMLWQQRSEKIALELSDVAADGRRSLKLSGDLAGKSLSLNADVMKSDADSVQLHRAKMDYGMLTLAGDLTVAESGLFGGSLALKTAALEEIAPLFNLDAAGAIDGRFEFSADGTTQDVRVEVTSSKFRIANARFSAVTISGQAQDLHGHRLFNLDLQSDFTDVDGIALQGLTAGVKRNALGIDLTAAAKRGSSTVTARGRATADSEHTLIRLETLTVSRAKQKVRLVEPLMLTITEEKVTFPRAHFVAGSGRIRSTGSFGQDTNLTLEVKRLPLWAAELLGAPIAASGIVTGAINVEGPARERRADFDLEIKNLTPVGARDHARNLWLSLKGSTDRAGLNFQSKLNDTRGRKFRVSGRVPFDKTGTLSVEADGSADLAALNTYISSIGDRIGGPVTVSAKISGTPEAPRVSGSVNIKGGVFRSTRAGIDLRDFTVQLTGLGRRIDLNSLAVKVPNSEVIRGIGEIHLNHAASFPIDLTLTSSNVQLVTTDLITIEAGLNAHLTGTLLGAQTIRGTGDVSRWDIRVPPHLSRHPAKMTVTRHNAPACIATVIELQSEKIENAKCSFGLELELRAPRGVLVHGRDIHVSFGGSVKMTGSTTEPAINGRFDLQHGSIALLSESISLSQGSITFSGDIVPALAASGEWRKHGITATITASGTATRPALSLASTPTLQQVEILARIVFGKSMPQLSPAQAAKIKRAVASWSSVSAAPILLDRIRQASCIATLKAATGETANTCFNAGTYAGSGVFINVTQNAEDQTATTTEVTLTQKTKLRSDAMKHGTTHVGILVAREG